MNMQSCPSRKRGTRTLLIFAAIMCCLTELTFARKPESVHAVPVSPGWNLMSLPACVTDGNKDILFPSSISPAYIFRTQSGYLAEDTLCHGIGFWLKFTAEDTVYIEGAVLLADTIEVQAGWNLIGSLSMPMAVGAIQSEPPGIINSQFFGYTPGAGYDAVDTLQPAHGYWVKVSQEGSLILQGAGMPCPGIPNVDYAGKTYNTVQIGSQCWLRENLDIGTMIQGAVYQSNNGTVEKYCFDDIPANCDTYGGLYQWAEAMQYSTIPGRRGICPPGWRIPTSVEFEALIATVGGDGNSLKEIGQGWGGGAGTNASGYSALLAGYRFDSGFFGLGGFAQIWSSTETNAANAQYLELVDETGLISQPPPSGYKFEGYSVRCLKNEGPNQPPDVPSGPVPEDEAASVSISPTLSWSCSDSDGDPLTYDIYFGMDNPPVTMVSSDQPDTSLVRTGLTSGTTYYWKVVAKDNHTNSTAGPVWSFRTITGQPCPGTPTIDYAGKIYNTVQIGNQCWLRENLDVGDMVPGVQNQTNNSILEKYCYDNDAVNCDAYGGLYQWDEAMLYSTTPGIQGICPPGWHIPTSAEFQTLGATVSGDGNALKEIGQGSGDGAGTNTSGFSGLLAGVRHDGGVTFADFGGGAYVWGSTTLNPWDRHGLYLSSGDAEIGLGTHRYWYGLSVRCLKDEVPNSPPDTPSNPIPDSGGTNVWTSPTLRWSCSDPESDPLTYDVYFGTDNPPATMVSSDQSDTSLARTGLSSGTTYYWRVVAKDNHSQSTDGPVWSFTTQTGGGSPCPGTPTVTYTGKTYNTVLIGSQCWLKENLNVGTMLSGSQNQTDNDTIEKYCYYDIPANCDTYGGLYQWNEAMQYSTTPGTRGICPPGWHLPTLAEFQTLGATVQDDGNALKAIGQGSGGGAGTNTSGFTALLAGTRYLDGVFGHLGDYGLFWGSTQSSALYADRLLLGSGYAAIGLSPFDKRTAFSVRCLKD